MPNADRFQVANAAIQNGMDKIFMVSGFATDAVKEKAKEIGIKSVFEKPLCIREITESLDYLLSYDDVAIRFKTCENLTVRLMLRFRV